MNRYRLIIFDFDGTLANTYNAISLCIAKTFQRFHVVPPSQEAIKSIIGLNLVDAFRLLNAPIYGKTDLSNWIAIYRALYTQIGEIQTALFPGTKEILVIAVRSGLKLAVISNKGTDAIYSSLERYGIRQLVSLVVGEDTQVIKKPDPMLFYSIIQPLIGGIRNTETLVVGDTITDLLFAKNSKLDCCWASYGYGNREECIAMKPTYIINDISELYSILFQKCTRHQS
jgi:phosphoglycolate phosphatase